MAHEGIEAEYSPIVNVMQTPIDTFLLPVQNKQAT